MNLAPFFAGLLLVANQPYNFDAQVGKIEGILKQGPNHTEKALPLLKDMEQQAAKGKNADYLLYARWRRGWCEWNLGRMDEAKKTFAQADAEAPAGHGLRFKLHKDFGELLLRTWDTAKARTQLQKARALGGELLKNPANTVPPREEELIAVDLLLAQCLLVEQKDKAARKELNRIHRTLARRKGKKRTSDWLSLVLECQGQLASLDRREGDLISALERIQKCLEELEARDDAPSRQRCFNIHLYLPSIYRELTLFEAGKTHLAAARKLLPSMRTKRRQADLDAAEASLLVDEMTFALAEERGGADLRMQLATAGKLAVSAREALDALATEQGKANVFTANAVSTLSQVHELRARVHALAGRKKQAATEYEEARKYADEAAALFGKVFADDLDNDHVLHALRRQAMLKLRTGDVADARKQALALLERARRKSNAGQAKAEDGIQHGEFYHLLIEVEAAAGNLEDAARYARAHRKIARDHLIGYLARLTAPEQISFLRRWDDSALHASLRLGIRPKGPAEASAEWLLNGKARTAEFLAEANRHKQTGEVSELLQTSVRRQARILYGQPGVPVETRRDELLAEQREQQRLRRTLKIGKPPIRRNLNDLRKGLLEGEVYIDVFRLRADENSPLTYHAWVVKNKGPVEVVKLGNADCIDEYMNAFIKHQEDFLTDDGPYYDLGGRQAEKELQAECLKPLSGLLLSKELLRLIAGSKRWAISLDGPLWNLPFGALIRPGSEKYLAEEVVIRYAVSGRDLIPKEAVKTGPPWVLAGPDFDSPRTRAKTRRPKKGSLYFNELPYARKEGERVAQLLESSLKVKPRVVKNETNAKDELLALEQPPRVLYFATHGFFASDAFPTFGGNLGIHDPLLRCFVVFGGANDIRVPVGKQAQLEALPALMTGAEVVAANLRGTELVVLSSCQSGTGEALPGQSPADLRQAFHIAGARAVVSTLWSVSDKHSSDLMTFFIEPLAKRDLADKAGALTDAQRKMIQTLRADRMQRHAHPFFWAAFTLSGS
jgi:CHAT domain-containing protein